MKIYDQDAPQTKKEPNFKRRRIVAAALSAIVLGGAVHGANTAFASGDRHGDIVPKSQQAKDNKIELYGRAEYPGDTLSHLAVRMSEESGIPVEHIKPETIADLNDGISTDPTDGVFQYDADKGIGEPARAVIVNYTPEQPTPKQ